VDIIIFLALGIAGLYAAYYAVMLLVFMLVMGKFSDKSRQGVAALFVIVAAVSALFLFGAYTYSPFTIAIK